jgi:Tfp pilus assembly protein PilV
VLIALIVLAAVLAVTAWQGKQIAANAQTISNQKAQLAELKATASLSNCEGRLCVQIDTTAQEYQNGYRVIYQEKN